MMAQTHHSYTPGSTFVVRIAGLPIDILLPLRFNQTMKLINDLAEGEDVLRAQAEPLSNALYSVIGSVEDKQIRYQLIALRRAIFQIQMPRDLSDHAWLVLPAKLANSIRVWIEHMKQQRALLACGPTMLEAEWAEKRCELQRIAHKEILQQGLVLGSKDLYDDAMRWLQVGSEGIPRRNRQLELGIFTYLSRMTTKTSPFSTFMGSGRGYWVDEGPVLTCAMPWQRHSAIELNWSIAHRIAYEIAGWPEIRPALYLRVNPSLIEDDSHLSFLGWKQGEVVMKLANSPTMRHILQITRSAEDRSYAAIIKAIVQIDTQGRNTEVQRFLDHLIKVGLLELDFGIPDLSYDYLGQLLSYLQQFQSQQVEAISLLLHKVHNCLQRYAAAIYAAERYELYKMIYATLESVYQQLGLHKRSIQVPTKYAFYENVLIKGGDVRCSLASWHQVLDDLSLLQQLSALYDKHLPGRLAANAFFVDHYGKGASIRLLHFYEDFCREKLQPGGWRAGYQVSGSHLAQLFENNLSSPPSTNLAELDQVYRLRKDLYQRFVKQSVDSSHVCQLNQTALRNFVADFPKFLSLPRSLNFYGQMLVRNGAPYLVLNSMRSGFRRSEGRMQLLETQIDNLASPHPTTISPEEGEPLWTDILGVFGSNISLRIAQTSHEITYPGTVSARTLDEQFPLNDLYVVHDPRRNCLRLVSHRLQRDLLPVHLSLLADFWQPPMYRFLIHIFSEGTTNALLPMMQMPDTKVFDATSPVQNYPRICLGNLVIGRATWIVGVQHLPMREKGASSFDYMLKIQHWLRAHHIPQECFIRIPADLPNLHAEKEGMLLPLTKDRKPLHIDFSNYLSVMMFEQMVSHAEHMPRPAERVLLLQEMLPGREDLVLSDGKATYVSEFIIELTQTEKGQKR